MEIVGCLLPDLHMVKTAGLHEAHNQAFGSRYALLGQRPLCLLSDRFTGFDVFFR